MVGIILSAPEPMFNKMGTRHKQILEKTVLDAGKYTNLYRLASIKINRSISKSGHIFSVQFKTQWRGMYAIKRALEWGPWSECSERNWFFPIYAALKQMEPNEYLGRYGDNKILFKSEKPMYKFLQLVKRYDKTGKIPRDSHVIISAPRVTISDDKVTELSDINLMGKNLPQIYKPGAKGRYYIQAKPAYYETAYLKKIGSYCKETGITCSKHVFEYLTTEDENVLGLKNHRDGYWLASIWFAVDDLSVLGFLTLMNPKLTHQIYINSAYGVKHERKDKTEQVS